MKMLFTSQNIFYVKVFVDNQFQINIPCIYIYIYVCVCVYIYICVCVCIYICVCRCVCVRTYVCVSELSKNHEEMFSLQTNRFIEF